LPWATIVSSLRDSFSPAAKPSAETLGYYLRPLRDKELRGGKRSRATHGLVFRPSHLITPYPHFGLAINAPAVVRFQERCLGMNGL
jgi:hypothetical protein